MIKPAPFSPVSRVPEEGGGTPPLRGGPKCIKVIFDCNRGPILDFFDGFIENCQYFQLFRRICQKTVQNCILNTFSTDLLKTVNIFNYIVRFRTFLYLLAVDLLKAVPRGPIHWIGTPPPVWEPRRVPFSFSSPGVEGGVRLQFGSPPTRIPSHLI